MMPRLISRALVTVLAMAWLLAGLAGCAGAPHASAFTGQVIAATNGSVIGSVAGGAVASKAPARLVWQVSLRFEDGIDRSFTVDQRPD